MIIAIDGPAGAGKSTVAKTIAKKLKFLYIDTGAMYRALALKALENKIEVKDADALVRMAKDSRIELSNNPDGSLKILLDGRDISSEIRQPRITKVVSDIAKLKDIREVMVQLQRHFGRHGNVVLDGRDIGTVVFPDADKKFFIDAQFKERVNRRYKELIGMGQKISLSDVEADLHNRDTIDTTRKVAPLKKAEDAVYIDTTDLNIEEAVDKVYGQIINP